MNVAPMQQWCNGERGTHVQPDGKLVVGGWTAAPIGDLMEVARFKGEEDLVFIDGFESGSTDWWGDWGL